jgi:AraC-like DNA-binding protein
VVFVPARVRFDCDNEGHVEHLYAHFDLVGLSPHSPAFDRPLVLTRDPSMSRALVELGSDLRRGGPTLAAQLKVKSILFQALARLMESLSPEETERQRRINAKLEPIEPALRRIDGDVSRRWTVGELAKSCNLSESHFARLFREALGQTPAAYATERRVAEAARLLLFTDLSVEQVAAQTGFPNRFHFSRVFAEAMGEGPATYRRRTPP